jgi:hypothetical protein
VKRINLLVGYEILILKRYKSHLVAFIFACCDTATRREFGLQIPKQKQDTSTTIPSFRYLQKSIKMSYLVKLASLEKPLSEVPERFTVPKPWQAHWYFFYDTLMQHSELSKILQLPETPILRPAFVKSYTLATYPQSSLMKAQCQMLSLEWPSA